MNATARRSAALALALSAAACSNSPTGAPPSSSAQATSAPAGSAQATSAQAAAPPSAAAAATSSASKEPPAASPKSTDTIPTSAGDLRVTPVHHGTVLLEHGGKAIYLDPWSEGSFDGLPKADLVLVTDIHQDHLDKSAIEKIKKPGTVIAGPAAAAAELPGMEVIKNGESKVFAGVSVEAIPMYNKTRGPAAGKLFHDKGRGNGYVLTLGDKRVYASGDTECTDEMRALKNIDVAFVCMNLPYTMPPSEAAECVKAFRPKIVFPYHFRGSNLAELTGALAGEQGVDVRVRTWY